MKLWILILAVAAAAIWAACSTNRSDPLSADLGTNDYGGSLNTGKDRPNLAVTEQNKLELCQEVFEQLYSSFLKGCGITANAPFPGEAVRITGNYNGYAVVNTQPDTLEVSQTIVSSTFEITYFNFSESGKLFFGGKIGFSGSWGKGGDSRVPDDILLGLGLVFAGYFSGSIEFENFSLPIDSTGKLIKVDASAFDLISHPAQGSVTIRSGSETFKFNPYFRMIID
ncbi:MAG TPA: hypothetical protein VM123_11660 [archaeon]|nr:hypothetical protein [archaeon]